MSDWDAPTLTIGSKPRKPVVAKKESDVNGQSGLHRWRSRVGIEADHYSYVIGMQL